jgi:hypothetical protein
VTGATERREATTGPSIEGGVDQDFVACDVGRFAVGRRNHQLVWGESKPFDGFPGKEPHIDRHDSLQRVMRCDMLKVSGDFG